MVLIKKDYQTLKVVKRNLKGDYLISVENSVARGTIIKCFITLTRKEFEEFLDGSDQLTDEEVKDANTTAS
jgi:lipoate-protein ligase A